MNWVKILMLMIFWFLLFGILDFLFVGYVKYLNNTIASVIGVLVAVYLPKYFMVKFKR